MAIEKQYQVFVSSTYSDLQEERQEVMQALLELDCIPSGMELFPAANEDQWTLIKRVIDDCDYYLVIIAGRYGSSAPDGTSYTEKECKYALDHGKPIIGFLHKNPGLLPSNRCEENSSKKEKLEQFKELVKRKMCRFWESPSDLGSQVSRSLVRLIKDHPGIGWVRADKVPDEAAAEEMLRLRRQLDEMERQLNSARITAPESARDLAQGDDEINVSYSFGARDPKTYSDTNFSSNGLTTWNDIFAHVAPLMIDEASDLGLKIGLNGLVEQEFKSGLARRKELRILKLSNFRISDSDFQTIKVQLRALGLITKNTKQRSVRDKDTYWTLTPYGDTLMTMLRAIRRDSETPAQGDTVNTDSLLSKQNVGE